MASRGYRMIKGALCAPEIFAAPRSSSVHGLSLRFLVFGSAASLLLCEVALLDGSRLFFVLFTQHLAILVRVMLRIGQRLDYLLQI
jgi:hypothetical protein